MTWADAGEGRRRRGEGALAARVRDEIGRPVAELLMRVNSGAQEPLHGVGTVDHDSYEVVGLGEGLTSTAIRRIVPVCAVWLSGSYLHRRQARTTSTSCWSSGAEDLKPSARGAPTVHRHRAARCTKLNVRVDAYLLGLEAVDLTSRPCPGP